GLFNYQGTATVQRCTFVNCDALVGGAIMSYAGWLTAEHCTFFGNVATTGGGAIEAGSGNPQTFLRHCTIVSNSASAGRGVRFASGVATMSHCLVAANSTPGVSDVALTGTASYAQTVFNFIGDGSASGITNGTNGNLVGGAGPAALNPR